MSSDTNSLAHTKWNCKYHIVFAPKYRRQVIYGKIKRDIGVILRQLCERKGVEIIEAEASKNHIHYQEAPNLTKVEYGDHYERRFMKPKKLKANIEYTTPHGHVYRTDHKGRIKEVYADDLSLLDGGRNSYAQRTVGREDRLPDDDGGHLIARGFGGSKDIDNLVPQSKYINRSFKENGEWYNMKKEWQKAIKKGEK